MVVLCTDCVNIYVNRYVSMCANAHCFHSVLVDECLLSVVHIYAGTYTDVFVSLSVYCYITKTLTITGNISQRKTHILQYWPTQSHQEA